MSLEEFKKSEIAFFEEAIRKWNRLIELYNAIRALDDYVVPNANLEEANGILAWFQENYQYHSRNSGFGASQILPSGKEIGIDPVFDVIFRGSNIETICDEGSPYTLAVHLNEGTAHLRGHLGTIKNLKSLPKGTDADTIPLFRVRKTLSRCKFAIDQLGRRRKNKAPYLIEDEYDIQDLLRALLKLDFDDIRKEEWTPSYAGGSSRMDLLLKKEKIVIEVKKTSENLREEGIGKQLLVDIAKYKEHQDSDILVCFIYDPEHWIENPEGLKHDLERQSTKELKVEVIICSR